MWHQGFLNRFATTAWACAHGLLSRVTHVIRAHVLLRALCFLMCLTVTIDAVADDPTVFANVYDQTLSALTAVPLSSGEIGDHVGLIYPADSSFRRPISVFAAMTICLLQ